MATGYELLLQPQFRQAMLQLWYSDHATEVGLNYLAIEKDKWRTVIVDVQGDQSTVYIDGYDDGVEKFGGQTPEKAAGGLTFSAYTTKNSIVQVDDVTIWTSPSADIAVTPATPTTSTITVDGKVGWQDSGISIGQGARIEVKYLSGQWTDNTAGDWTEAKGYAGTYPRSIEGLCGQAPLPDSPQSVLAGRIGTSGPAFQIGTQLAFTADRSGSLYLRMNDADPCLGDNGGSIQVTVSISH